MAVSAMRRGDAKTLRAQRPAGLGALLGALRASSVTHRTPSLVDRGGGGAGRSLRTPTDQLAAVTGQPLSVTRQLLVVNSQIPLVNSQPLSVDQSTAVGDEPTTVVWRPAHPFFAPKYSDVQRFSFFSSVKARPGGGGT